MLDIGTLARAVRRHARRAHRRHRALQGHRRGRRRGGRAAHRGDHRQGRARVGAGAGARARRRRGRAEGAGRRARGAHRAAHGAGARGGDASSRSSRRRRRPRPGDDLAGGAADVGGVKVVAASIDGADAKSLRETVDKLKDKLKSAAIVLGSVADGKVTLIAGVTSDLIAQREGGRARQPRRDAGRRQGRRPSGHGAGGRHRSAGAAGRAQVGARLGRAAALAPFGRRRSRAVPIRRIRFDAPAPERWLRDRTTIRSAARCTTRSTRDLPRACPRPSESRIFRCGSRPRGEPPKRRRSPRWRRSTACRPLPSTAATSGWTAARSA